MKVKKGQNEKRDYGRIEDGSYFGRLVQIVDFGIHYKTDWKTGDVMQNKDGSDKKYHPVFLTFEFPSETIEIDGEEKPRWLGKEYNLSTSDMAAIWDVTAALGSPDEFVAENLIQQPAMVTVGTTSGGKAKITGVSGVPKGIEVPPLSNPPFIFALGESGKEAFDSLPDWMKERISESLGFKGFSSTKAVITNDPSSVTTEEMSQRDYDDIPF